MGGSRGVSGIGRLGVGGLDDMDRGFSLSGFELKAQQALQKGALEVGECRVLRINGGIRFEVLKRFEQSCSEFAIGSGTTHE